VPNRLTFRGPSDVNPVTWSWKDAALFGAVILVPLAWALGCLVMA